MGRKGVWPECRSEKTHRDRHLPPQAGDTLNRRSLTSTVSYVYCACALRLVASQGRSTSSTVNPGGGECRLAYASGKRWQRTGRGSVSRSDGCRNTGSPGTGLRLRSTSARPDSCQAAPLGVELQSHTFAANSEHSMASLLALAEPGRISQASTPGLANACTTGMSLAISAVLLAMASRTFNGQQPCTKLRSLGH